MSSDVSSPVHGGETRADAGADPRFPPPRRRARGAAAARPALAPHRGVGGLAGQHAAGRAALDPRPRRGRASGDLGRRRVRPSLGAALGTYVVPAEDHAIFTRRTPPRQARGRQRAEDLAARDRFIAGRPWRDLGDLAPCSLRHDDRHVPHPLGRRPRARIWTVPRPAIEPLDARRELARRYLHVFGPGTSASFAKWAGVTVKEAQPRSDGLELFRSRRRSGTSRSLPPTRRCAGAGRALDGGAPAAERRCVLAHYDAARRELLVPGAKERAALWTPRVWPGALLVAGELAGTWRRSRRTSRSSSGAADEGRTRGGRRGDRVAAAPGLTAPVAVRWLG